MTSPAIDPESQTLARYLARGSALAALVSCALNCLFVRLTGGPTGRWWSLAWLSDWTSLAIVLAGIGCGCAGIVLGVRRRSADTALIASIGLVLNLTIVFVMVWFYASARPAGEN
ncbi:MAG: hypothetical protein SFU86_22840 [Pirellulaceae bacterium]|nr:hypothetical protein [Pirellulaceae bacterium]